ncbi:MAG TPA: aminoglycoside adenylyltransferase domain-containing protein [Bacillales bacterium]|nr:aminoglycoside adenylyltransferase domain-containing protein [Bacillales bacterium]
MKNHKTKLIEIEAPETVNQQLAHFTDELKDLLKDQLTGIYLHGSLAMGDFNVESSDVDLLVVVKYRLSEEHKSSLIRILLSHSGKPAPIEISFLTGDQLNPWRHPCPFDLHYGEDWRERYSSGNFEDLPENDEDLAGHIMVLQKRGMVLYGETIAAVFPEIPVKDYLDSVMSDLDWSLDEVLQEKPTYTVLNHCRTYAFLCKGKVLSKGEGGEWMLERVPDSFLSVVKGAIAAYRFTESFGASAAETEAFLRWIRSLIQMIINK